MVIKILLFASLFTISGCAGLIASLINPPKVDVDSVRVTNLNLNAKGLDIEIDLKVDNPNETPLQVDKIKYDFSLADSSVINGVFSKPVELKKGITVVTIPATLNLEATKKAVGNYLLNSIDTYSFKAAFTSSGITVPVENKGKFQLKK